MSGPHREPAPRRDRRRGPERRVRSAWRSGAGPGLRLASSIFGLAADLRNLAYESGFAAPRPSPVPVLSVGGLTVGGSGKTPLAASAAGSLLSRGVPTAVVSRGFDDELEVHRRLNPGAVVTGAPERARAVDAAVARGARVAVLDDGFQHRRLGRDLEWTVVRAEDAGRRAWERLPAGPARDRWGELARSDAVILTCRDPSPGSGLAGLMGCLRLQFPAAAVAACRIRSTGLEAVNAAAAARPEAAPRVAFASVMHGEEFLDRQAASRPGLEHTYLFPDHHHIEEETVAEMARAAGEDGMMGTLKDVVKVAGRLDPRIPLWYVSEEVAWAEGSRRLSAQLDHLAWLGGGSGGGHPDGPRFGDDRDDAGDPEDG